MPQPSSLIKNYLITDLLLFAIALIAYAPILSGWYTADDFWHLEAFSPPLGTVVKHIFSGHVYLDHPDWHYRPLTNFVLMLVCRSHSAFVGHLLCVMLHAMTGMALFRLLLRMGRGAMAAAIGAMLFVLLPAAAPAVCWISSIGDLMSAFFAVCAALLYVKNERSRARALRMGGLFALALISKEMTATLPFLLLFFSASRKKLRKDGRSLLVLFAVLTAFAILRTAIVGNPMSTPGAERFIIFSPKTLVNAVRYLSLIIVPVPTHMPLVHPLSFLAVLPLAAVLVLGAAVRGLKTAAIGLAGGLTALLFSLVPVANAFQFWYSYVPAVLFAVVISGVMPRSFKPACAWAAGALLIISGANTFLIATEWQHAGTFQKNLFAEIASIPDDTLRFGNFPRISYSATLLAGRGQLYAGLAYLYGIRTRTIYIYGPRWYEHIAPDVTLRMETAPRFTLTVPPKSADFFMPYLIDGQDSSDAIVRFSDYTSFSGRPRTASIGFSHAVKLVQVEPSVDRTPGNP
jgi:hypothetical protein